MPRIPNMPPMFPRPDPPPAPPNIEISDTIRSIRRSARGLEYTNDAEFELGELIKKYNLNYNIIAQIQDEIESYFFAIGESQECSRLSLVNGFVSEFKYFVNSNGNETTIFQDTTFEFREEFVWIYISGIMNLSETFIRKYKDRLDWKWIFLYQDLSDELLLEFRNRADPLKMPWKLKELIEKEIKSAGKTNEQIKENRVKNLNAINWLSVD